ncbi:MAG: hypothetical protein ACXVBF_00815 [Flavisolibacter sp.]
MNLDLGGFERFMGRVSLGMLFGKDHSTSMWSEGEPYKAFKTHKNA